MTMKKLLATIALISIIGCWNYSYAQNVSFVASVYSGCPPLTVNFTNTSSAGTVFTWYMDTNLDTVLNTSHVFNTSGKYWVSLYAYDNDGNYVGHAYTAIDVYGSVDFYVSDVAVCPNEEITFSSGVNSNSYLWSFGDGANAASSYVKHSYAAPGTYDVSLILNTPCGMDTVSKQIVVDNSLVPPNYTISNSSSTYYTQYNVCPGEPIRFYANAPSYYYDDDLTFDWDFGDGTSLVGDNRYPFHSFSSPGNYTVTLLVLNSCGLSTSYQDTVFIVDTISVLAPVFSYNPVPGCPYDQFKFNFWGLYASQLWDFGDGTTDTTQNPLHTFVGNGTYVTTLTVTNSCGNSNSYSKTVTVSDTVAPLAVPYFTNLSDTICPGDKFKTFEWPWDFNEGSVMWDFGDGTQDTGAIPSHTYVYTGIYPVTKTITSSCGYSASYTDTVVVTNSATPLNPFFAVNEACPGDSIKFEPYIPIPYTYGLTRPYSAYMLIWDFGDGDVDTTYNGYSYHAYTATGMYNVNVTAINNCGNSSSFTGQVSIINNSIPYAYIWWPTTSNNNFYSPCENIEFTAQNGWSANNVKYSYEWDFGDGSTLATSSTSATHAFDNPGIYTIKLIASNNCGNQYSVKQDITIDGVCAVVNSEFSKSEAVMNVLIYPNPFSASTTIEFENGKKETHTLAIYDITGQLVRKINNITTGQIKIERENLVSGLYVFQLMNNATRVGKGKIIVE